MATAGLAAQNGVNCEEAKIIPWKLVPGYRKMAGISLRCGI
jgi:hypothetical protein